ncbi:MAG: hypothetical protein Q4C41_06255 [Eggerthellaceae bacterium]|nr:hypothetical protein [Eggerthellaceae bacterium]
MKVIDQVKTPQGQLPAKKATLTTPSENGTPTLIEFDLLSPQELAARSASQSTPDAPRSLSVEGLSVIKWLNQIEPFAQQSGPLFGLSSVESVADWQSAITVARAVVSMQEALNGAKTLGASTMPVEKFAVRASNTGSEFTLYTVSFDLGAAGASDYARIMPPLPWFRKFRQHSGFDYSFMSAEVDEGRIILSAFLLSFSREISMADFAAAVTYFMDDPSVMQEALVTFAHDSGTYDDASGGAGGATSGGLGGAPSGAPATLQTDEIIGLLSTTSNLLVTEASLGEDDYPHLQKLVYALISLHLQGVTVDVFSSTEGNDFMSFNTYLSYLWYGFAKQLGQVKIGYCAICGTGFSLTGHRGIARRFCSEKCKTKAKNERTKAQRDEAREMFAAGRDVAEVARALYPSELPKEARNHVCTSLRGWRALQHDVDEAIVLRGERLELLERVIREGVWTKTDIAKRAQYLKDNPRLMREVQQRAKGK